MGPTSSKQTRFMSSLFDHAKSWVV